MMAKRQLGVSKGSSKKVGRNKVKCAKYKLEHCREQNKFRRILRSSGAAELKRYAERCGLWGMASRLGQLPKRIKGPGCKPGGLTYGGPNPPLPTEK